VDERCAGTVPRPRARLHGTLARLLAAEHAGLPQQEPRQAGQADEKLVAVPVLLSQFQRVVDHRAMYGGSVWGEDGERGWM